MPVQYMYRTQTCSLCQQLSKHLLLPSTNRVLAIMLEYFIIIIIIVCLSMISYRFLWIRCTECLTGSLCQNRSDPVQLHHLLCENSQSMIYPWSPVCESFAFAELLCWEVSRFSTQRISYMDKTHGVSLCYPYPYNVHHLITAYTIRLNRTCHPGGHYKHY